MDLLPPELWLHVLRFATLPDTVDIPSGVDYHSVHCSKKEPQLVQVALTGEASVVEAYAQLRTKCALSLVNKNLRQLSERFLYEDLFILNEDTAEKLAQLLEDHNSRPANKTWTKRLIIALPHQTSISSCYAIASTVIRIVSKLRGLKHVFFSMDIPLSCEAQIVNGLPLTVTHLEWHNHHPGGGFQQSSSPALSHFLFRMQERLVSLCVSGYPPLPFASGVSDAEGHSRVKLEFPCLRQLMLSRALRRDLSLISTWSASQCLSCLSLEVDWILPGSQAPQFAFFKNPLPSLQCLHLGMSRCPELLQTILKSTTHLCHLDYTFTGGPDVDLWEGIQHHRLKCIEFRLHPGWDLRELDSHIRFFSAKEWLRADDGKPIGFNSLKCLKIVISPPLPGIPEDYVGRKRELKALIQSANRFATQVTVDFIEEG